MMRLTLSRNGMGSGVRRPWICVGVSSKVKRIRTPTQCRRNAVGVAPSIRVLVPKLRLGTSPKFVVQAFGLQVRPGRPYHKHGGLRRCAPASKVRSFSRKCASWKTPEISSKVRSLFQGAHLRSRSGRSSPPNCRLQALHSLPLF